MEMKKSELTHGSLFSGIGGFELGAEMAGIDTLWNCEIEKFQGEILKNKFPHAERFTDITKTTGLRYVDIISGGFPCQDISVAGKREGIKEIETDIIRSRFEDREYVRDGLCSYFRIGENAFTDKSEALKKAEEMKIRKIASLRKQMEKLEKLSFKVEEKQQ